MQHVLLRDGPKASRPAITIPSTTLPAAISGLGIRAETPKPWPRAIQRLCGEPAVIQANAAGGQSGELAGAIGALRTGFDTFKAQHGEFQNGVQHAIDDINMRIAAGQMRPGEATDVPPDPEYSKLYATFLRTGQGEDRLREANATGQRAKINAAMDSGNSQNGGYLAPVEWDRRINAALNAESPIRRLASVVATSVGAWFTLWTNDASMGSGWVGETSARPATTTPPFTTISFDAGEIYANPAITQRLLDDSVIDLPAWLTGQISGTFGRQESVAFLSGNGVNKPMGVYQYLPGGEADATPLNGKPTSAKAHPAGNIPVVKSGDASTLKADSFVDVLYALGSPYRPGASWLMNSTTAQAISKMKDGQGNYLWRDNYQQGQPQTLLGYPVEIDENMPDIAAGAMPVIFGNWKRGYVINDRATARTLRDPYTNKPYVHLYTTKRVGGWVQDPLAFRFLQVGA